MHKHDKIEKFKYIYENVNSWINNVDNKISILLAFSATILGFLISTDIYINVVSINKIFSFTMNLIIILLSLSCIMCLAALIARVKLKNTLKSNIFFGSIASRDRKDYFESVLEINDDIYIEDLTNQIYINACICDKKFKLYNFSLKIMLIAAAIAVIMLFIYLT